MLIYITIIVSTIISLIGILLKTKEDSNSPLIYRLTKFGWILVTLVLSMLIITIITQLQRSKIEKLQALVESRKKAEDSIRQVTQQQNIQLLLVKQIEKSKSDSLNLFNQIRILDSVRFTQSISLREQMANSQYLRTKLSEQEQAYNKMLYKVDTLYINTRIDIYLTDSFYSSLVKKLQDYIPDEDRPFGSVSYMNIFPAIKVADPKLYDYFIKMKLVFYYNAVVGIPLTNVYGRFLVGNLIDTIKTKPRLMGCSGPDYPWQPFVSLEIDGKNKLRLTIYQLPSSETSTTDDVSFKDICDKEVVVSVFVPREEDQKITTSMGVNCLQIKSKKDSAMISTFKFLKSGKATDDPASFHAFKGKTDCYF